LRATSTGPGFVPVPACRAIPVFRPLALRVRGLLDTPGDRSSEIADLVQADPGLCLGLLVEANRAFGAAGVDVTSVDVALQVLGWSACRRLVDGSVEHCVSPVGRELAAYVDAVRFGVVTSLAAGALAEILGTVEVGEARGAGLLRSLPALRRGNREALVIGDGVPERLVRAVCPVAGESAEEDEEDLGFLLQLAERSAREMMAAPPHLTVPEERADRRVLDLEHMVRDRIGTCVSDGLLVLGVLLGQSRLDVAGFSEAYRGLLESEPRPMTLPAGLPRDVHEALRSIRDASSEPGALHALLCAIRRTAGVERTLLVLEDAGESMLSGTQGDPPFFARTRGLAKMADGCDELVLSAHQEGRSTIARRGMGFAGLFAAFQAEEILAVPVRAGKQPVGTVLVPSEIPLPAGLGPAFDVLSHAVGEAMERVQLSRRTFLLTERITKDALTGVLQRGHLMELLEAEIRVANRYGRPLALVMLDVDDFKAWNDSHGHQVGDTLLRDVARVILACSREGDLTGRYGGDEFMIVLPGRTAEQARVYAERVRGRVEDLGRMMTSVWQGTELSVSLGVASVTSHPADAGTLMFRADHALYRAKARGRNRVQAEGP